MYELTLLGPVTLRRLGVVVPLATAKAAALLVLLALGGPAHRARIAGWLWPSVDDAAARRNLRRELARLREAGVGELLRSDGDVLALAGAPLLRCDAWAFRDGAASPHESDIDAALALWRGPPADGLELGGTDAFDDWLQAEREQLIALRRRALQVSAAAHEARGELDAALARIETLLAEDPLQEQLHREAMRLHLAAGRREAALAQFRRCRELLQRELGLAPMAATEALAEQAALAAPAQAVSATPAPQAGPTAVHAAGRSAEWPAELPLTGRDQVWAALLTAWPGDDAEGLAACDEARARAADAGTPRPLAMALRQALAARAAATGDERSAAAARAAFEALRQRLADSLAGRPALRASLLARWR